MEMCAFICVYHALKPFLCSLHFVICTATYVYICVYMNLIMEITSSLKLQLPHQGF